MIHDLDSFELLVRDALQSDEQPGAGFTDAVMARVAVTPQAAPQKKAVPYGKYIAAAAACLVLVYAGTIPLRWRAGSAGPQNASSASSTAESPAQAEEFSSNSAYGAPAARADEADGSALEAVSEPTAASHSFYDTKRSESAQDNGDIPVYTVSDPAACTALRTWLDEHGYIDDGGYVLHADDVASMAEAVAEYPLPAGDCVLVLEA